MPSLAQLPIIPCHLPLGPEGLAAQPPHLKGNSSGQKERAATIVQSQTVQPVHPPRGVQPIHRDETALASQS